MNFRRRFAAAERNTKIFDSKGIEFEVANQDGGSTAVDTFTFEGPGLTIIGGAGFIPRFDNPTDMVRIRFSNFKDDFVRNVFAFDFAADYTRDPSQTNLHSEGNATGGPPQ